MSKTRKRTVRRMVKCPLQKRFVRWETCAFYCKYGQSYNVHWKEAIWCSYQKVRPK